MRSFGLAVTAFCLATSPPAVADVIHVVQPGHTLDAIARRYHVSEQAIVEANHLEDTDHLKPGQTLVIPGVTSSAKRTEGAESSTSSAKRTEGAESSTSSAKRAEGAESGAGHALATPPGGARQPLARGKPVKSRPGRGVVQLVRTGEEVRVRVKGARGQVPSSALDAFERIMRQGAATHSPDPRLVTLIGIVSDHFGGKPVEVVSGYRAYTPTQYTPHSNHNFGRALDFRIEGVSDQTLYGFCLTLRKVGCGYYPNSTFVHMDVRPSNIHWVDRSRPGEPPQYDRPGVAADEGRGEVHDESETPPALPPVARDPASHAPSEPPSAPTLADGETAL